MKKHPISIIIPVYNSEKFIHRTMKSILNQTIKPQEILIMDDGSTDNSLSILKEYEKKYKNIHVFTQKNKGPSKTRNTLISKAKEKYIAICDADDYYFPWFLKKQLKAIEKEKTISSHATYLFLDKNIKNMFKKNLYLLLNRFSPDWNPFYYSKIKNKTLELLFHNTIPNSSSFLNNERIKKNNYLYNEKSTCEDYELWVQISFKNKINISNFISHFYIQHPHQFSHLKQDQIKKDILKVSKKILENINVEIKESDLFFKFINKQIKELNNDQVEKKFILAQKIIHELEKKFTEEKVEDLVLFFLWKSLLFYKNNNNKKHIKELWFSYFIKNNWKSRIRYVLL